MMENDNCSTNDSSSEDGWEEIEDTIEEDIICLFCPLTCKNIEDSLLHLKVEHKFDLIKLKAKHDMNCYDFIKMINYVRATNATSAEIMNYDDYPWKHEEYLKPTIQDDPWIMFDFEEYVEDKCNHIPDKDVDVLELQSKLIEREAELESLQNDLKRMKETVSRIADDDQVVPISNYDDKGYFESYDKFDIHYEMLSDEVRTLSYKKAIELNSDKFKNKIVLDVGCGTGILSMFAASSGAAKVYAVDMSSIVEYTNNIVRENNFENTIEVLRGRMEDIELENVDIIISEWMGYFLLFEGMMSSVIHARDKFLKKGGLILPTRCEMYLTASCDPDYSLYESFWSNVYGYKMSSIRNKLSNDVEISETPSEYIISSTALIKSFDMAKCGKDDCNFESPFTLIGQKDSEVKALVGYFDTFFDLKHKVYFSTSPFSKTTHWEQTLFYLPKSIPLKTGEELKGVIRCSVPHDNPRALKIHIKLQECDYEYDLT